MNMDNYTEIQNVVTDIGTVQYQINKANTTFQDSEFEAPFFHYLWVVITPTLILLIMTIGSFGNIMVVYVILKNKSIKTLTNILLLNLAFADILFLWICLPFQTYKFVSFHFPFGDIACKVVQYCLYVSVYVTVWTLVAISALRYLIVVKPKCAIYFRTKKNIVCACVMIWFIILLFNIPTLLAHKVNTWDQLFNFCGVDPTKTGAVLTSFFVCAYLVPVCIMFLLYSLVVHYLYRRNMYKQNHRQATLGKKFSRHARKMLMTLVFVFAISWLPIHVHNLWSYYGKVPTSKYYEVFRIICYCMAYSNSLANPIIYSFLSEDFQAAFKTSFSCCFCCMSIDNIRSMTAFTPTSTNTRSTRTLSLMVTYV